MRLEDLGIKVKKMGEREFKRRSSIPVKTPILDTGKDSSKMRKIKWDRINKDETLEQIRLRKLQKIVEKQVLKDKKQELSIKMQNAYRVWQKVDWVMKCLIEPEAYLYLDMIRKTEPKVYREIFKLLVDQQTVAAIDDIIGRIRKFGIKEGKKINKMIIGKYYRKVKGIEPKIFIERGGVRRALSAR